MSVGEMVLSLKVQNFIGIISFGQKHLTNWHFTNTMFGLKCHLAENYLFGAMFGWRRYNYGPDNISF